MAISILNCLDPNLVRPLDIAVVIPTLNERQNISEIIARLEESLTGLRWELIFVDDDSPDGTADIIRANMRRDDRIRLVHRIGRRGLSSACIEGIMTATANYVAVMDADLQHDETILPTMLHQLHQESLDVVVGTRNARNGSMGEFCKNRLLLSNLGRKFSNLICSTSLSDPMSGFFLVNRSFFLEIVRDLQGNGFKILVEMIASSQRPVRIGEVGYCFRKRRYGDSKLDVNTGIEYLVMVINKLIGTVIPVRFAIFSLVGATGVATHLLCLSLLLRGHLHFSTAQVIATFIAMIENFFLNNLITYRDRRLRGIYLLSGLASFCIACSFGAWANVVFATALLQSGKPWYIAGLAGIVLSSVWNYSVTSLFTWQMPTTRRNVHVIKPVKAFSTDLGA
jgi:dolichol-phosphate mannosyltransferase